MGWLGCFRGDSGCIASMGLKMPPRLSLGIGAKVGGVPLPAGRSLVLGSVTNIYFTVGDYGNALCLYFLWFGGKSTPLIPYGVALLPNTDQLKDILFSPGEDSHDI